MVEVQVLQQVKFALVAMVQEEQEQEMEVITTKMGITEYNLMANGLAEAEQEDSVVAKEGSVVAEMAVVIAVQEVQVLPLQAEAAAAAELAMRKVVPAAQVWLSSS